MSPSLSRWLISAAFGLLAGWSLGGLAVPALSALLALFSPGAGGPDGPDLSGPLVPALVVLVQIAVATLVTLWLARMAETQRRLGWGCVLLGAAALLYGPVMLVVTGALGKMLNPGADRDGATAAFFVTLLSLPYLLLGLVLLAGGWVLLRRSRAAAPPAGPGAPRLG